MEVCGLEEIGYKIGDKQKDLTLLQKLFLLHAYPIFYEEQKRQNENNKEPSTPKSNSIDPNWLKRQKDKRANKKR